MIVIIGKTNSNLFIQLTYSLRMEQHERNAAKRDMVETGGGPKGKDGPVHKPDEYPASFPGATKNPPNYVADLLPTSVPGFSLPAMKSNTDLLGGQRKQNVGAVHEAAQDLLGNAVKEAFDFTYRKVENNQGSKPL